MVIGVMFTPLYIYIFYTAKNVAPAPSGEHESGFAGPALCEGLGDLGGSTRHRFPRHGEFMWICPWENNTFDFQQSQVSTQDSNKQSASNTFTFSLHP